MKTICPHCKEVFPETPDEYLGMTLECPICQKQFVCEKPMFCPECGAIHPAKASACAQCGHRFSATPPPPPPVQPPVQNYGPGNYAYGSFPCGNDGDCFRENVHLFTAWAKIFNFSGRSRRMEYGLFLLSEIVLGGLLLLLALAVPFLALLMSIVCLLGFYLVNISLSVRRLHDIGLSGWWYIWVLFTVAPAWVLLLWPSQPGKNKWGPNPTAKPYPGYPHSVAPCLVTLLILGIIHFFIMPAAALLPALSKAREAAQNIKCVNNLKQVGLGVAIYMSENENKLPGDLQINLSPDIMRCPASSHEYIYLGNGLSCSYHDSYHSAYDAIPIAMDNPVNHGKKINIVYLDGHAESRSLSRKMTSCEEVLRELHPELSQSSSGRIVLENAKKADAQIR